MANTKDIVEHRGPQLTASASEIRIDLALPCRSPHRLETGGPPWARRVLRVDVSGSVRKKDES